MQKIISFLTLLLVVGALLFSFAPSITYAANPAKDAIQCGVNAAAGQSGCDTNPGATTSLNDTVKEVVNVLSAVVGIVAVVMIILGGFRYITSGGSAEKISGAKNTILYAIIGLVIVALAQAVVKFVLHKT